MLLSRSKLFALVLLLPCLALANEQTTNQSADDEVDKGREMIREHRLAVLREELSLTDEEAAKFWPLHSDFRKEMDAIQDRYADAIEGYVARYNNGDLNDEYADSLVDMWIEIKRELLGVQAHYLPEFRKILPGLKVARLYQLENKINAEIDAQLAVVVPLIDPN